MTSAAPTGWMWLAIALVYGSVLVRVVMLENTITNRRINFALSLEGTVALLRAPTVQDLLEPMLPNLALIRPLTHTGAMLAAVAIFGLATVWTGRPEPRWQQPVLYLGVLVLSGLMVWLSAPSRAAGMTIEDYGTWRAAVYHLCYALPPLLGIGGAGLVMVLTWKTAVTLRGRVITAVLVALTAISVIDNAFRPVAAVFDAVGNHNFITQLRGESNDLFFLPTIAVMGVVSAIPAFRRIWQIIGMTSQAQQTELLEPMWRSLTAAVPSVVLPGQAVRRDTHNRRLQRRTVEIRDAMIKLSDVQPAVTTAQVEQIVAAHSSNPDHDAALREAIILRSTINQAGSRFANASPTPTRRDTSIGEDWESEVNNLVQIANNWALAGQLLARLQTPTMKEHPQP